MSVVAGLWLLDRPLFSGLTAKPPRSSHLFRRYGLDGSEYLAENCSVSIPHSEIMCATIAGAGTGLLWNLKIDGQISRVSTTDYAAPMISRFEGPGAVQANTDGGQVRPCLCCLHLHLHVLCRCDTGAVLSLSPPPPIMRLFRGSSSLASTLGTTSPTWRQ